MYPFQEIELGPIETNNVLVSQGIIPEIPVVEEIGPAAIQPGNVEIINLSNFLDRQFSLLDTVILISLIIDTSFTFYITIK